MSQHLPKLLYDDLASSFVRRYPYMPSLAVDATVMACGTSAGVCLHASKLSLPAATTMVTPALCARLTAILMAAEMKSEPRLTLITAGLVPLATTQSKPIAILDVRIF